jgi:hypothetical protein
VTRPRASVAIAAVVGLLGVGPALDALLPEPAPVTPEPLVAGEATSGAWYCAAVEQADTSTVDVIAAVPPRDGGSPALVESDVANEGETVAADRDEIAPGAARRIATGGSDEAAGPSVVTTRWWGLPVAVSRAWSVERGDGVSGRIEGPCQSQPSDRWIVPGVATAGGAQAQLHLANPFGTDASVTVTLATRDGLLGPKLLENVVVPKRSTRVLDLNEYAPEQADLGVIVQTRSGRVVAEAVQSFNAAIGGVEGLSLVRALPAPSETWTVPWFADASDAASWLWLTNPDPDRPADVELTVHTDTGGSVPEGLGALTVDPGTTLRVDLRGLLPEGADSGGLTVRAENGVPIAASVATQRGGDLPAPDAPDDPATESTDGEGDDAPALGRPEDRSGVAVVTGVAEGDTTWVLSGGATAGRDLAIHLVNASAEEATVDLAVWSDAGLVRSPELQGLTVAPGAVRVVDLSGVLPEGETYTVFVSTRGGRVIAGAVASSREGRLDLTAATGQPMGVYAGGRVLPPVEFAPGMPQRLGTLLGPDAGDDPGVPDAEPTGEG